jgi:hypothetical protein
MWLNDFSLEVYLDSLLINFGVSIIGFCFGVTMRFKKYKLFWNDSNLISIIKTGKAAGNGKILVKKLYTCTPFCPTF